MTSYKLCLTILVIVSVSFSSTASALYDSTSHQRIRRSSNEKDQSAESTTEEADHHGFQAGYRFGEEFFLPEASKSIPAEYKKKADGCERVVKNSMVCMVCKDPKTNAKYEQCSYVGNPPPKAPSSGQTSKKEEVSYAPESSSESSESSAPPRSSYENYQSSTPSRGSSSYESPAPSRDSSSYESPAPSRGSSSYESSAPSRGSSSYESTSSPRSSSSYDSSSSPRDYSAYHSSSAPRGSEEHYESSTPSGGSRENYEASKPEATGYNYKDYAPAPYSYAESSKEDSESSEDPAASSDCRQIEKESQSCKICKDPKTGKDFERCSSSYKPDDKSYAYGKTEKYGYPESSEDDKADFKTFENNPDEYKSESSEDPAETSECRQVKKNDQTCTICKDPKTGGDSERCSSSYRPADKSYAYGNSEKFGASSPNGNKDYKSYNGNNDKSAEASYVSPSEYQSAYPKSSDDSYKYQSDLPEEYSQSNHDGGSEYHRSSPNYDGSDNAEYAAPSVPAASKKTSGNSGAKGCREIEKDSMTCTVCTDPKTGGNFEKCSYAYQPDDKVYKFTKSKTFGYPEAGEGINNRGEGRKSGKGSRDSTHESESKQILEAVNVNGCKQILKDSMICTVCKDPKTGGITEQCAYGKIPSEKFFTYTGTKSLKKERKEGAGIGKKLDQEGHQQTPGTRKIPQWSGEDIRQFVAESKQVADAVRSSPCRKIEKDSMTCTVCKDPKTGASSEQCSYSSKPKENLYTYSKSKSSGRPRKGSNVREKYSKDEREPRETKEIHIAEATNPCRKIEKDSMTCTVCKDPKTGENSEQCAYSYKPKERHFTYTKSKSFGNPRKEGKKGGKKSHEEKPEESHRVPRWSNDGEDYFTKVNRPRGFSKPDWSYRE